MGKNKKQKAANPNAYKTEFAAESYADAATNGKPARKPDSQNR